MMKRLLILFVFCGMMLTAMADWTVLIQTLK